MWFPFALTFALITSISVVIAKRVMSEMNEYLYLWITGILTIPFLLFLIIVFFQIPKFDNIFLINTAASIVINIFASILAYRAIRISEISLISPISAFNPVFTALISYITLHEQIGLTKKYIKPLLIIGVLAAVGQVAAMIAFSLTQLGFATAIFKLSMILSVILGWLFFKEHDIKERLLGSFVMLIGVLLLIK